MLRPHRMVAPLADSRCVLALILARLGFRQALERPWLGLFAVGVFVAAAAFAVYSGVVHRADPGAWIPRVAIAAVVGVVPVVLVLRMREDVYRGPDGVHIRAGIEEDGAEARVVVRDREAERTLAEGPLPADPVPHAALVPVLVRGAGEATGRPFPDGLSAARVATLRGWVLLGACARALSGMGYVRWRDARYGLAEGVLALLVAATIAASLPLGPAAGPFLSILILAQTGAFAWLRRRHRRIEGEDLPSLRLEDRIEGTAYALTLTGPAGTATVPLDAAALLGPDLHLPDPAPVAAAVAAAVAEACGAGEPAPASD